MSNNKIELKKKSKAKIYENFDEFDPTAAVAATTSNGNNGQQTTNISYSVASINKTIIDQGEIIFIGDGWASFPDLDNFDSDLLLRVLTLKVNSCELF
jgi:hypothetical protein